MQFRSSANLPETLTGGLEQNTETTSPPALLPVGAAGVYACLTLPIPLTEAELQAHPYPPELFANELAGAALLLRGMYPRREFPCLYNDAGQLAPSNPDDALLYDMALGLYAASLIVGTRANAPGVGGPTMVKRKAGDSEMTFKAVDAADRGAGWQAQAIEYMEALSCVGGDDAVRAGFLSGGLLQGAHPNTSPTGHLTDNRAFPLEAGWPLGNVGRGGRREIL